MRDDQPNRPNDTPWHRAKAWIEAQQQLESAERDVASAASRRERALRVMVETTEALRAVATEDEPRHCFGGFGDELVMVDLADGTELPVITRQRLVTKQS